MIVIPLVRTPMISTPHTAVEIFPSPPVSCPELIRASMMIPASPDKNPPIAYVATFNLFVLIPDYLAASSLLPIA